MNDTSIATIRTTWNTSLLTAISALLYKIFGWELSVDDLLPFLPIIIPVVGVFYRASLWLGAKYPTLGTILFGVNKKPGYSPEA